jgi:hypothetical protein
MRRLTPSFFLVIFLLKYITIPGTQSCPAFDFSSTCEMRSQKEKLI